LTRWTRNPGPGLMDFKAAALVSSSCRSLNHLSHASNSLATLSSLA
jgi:hypothetical protein